jgi:Na+-transporting methylmalonyl-CoA/oxaloacetate decarboxylase beta subunit
MAFTTTTITMIFFLSLTSLFFYLHRQRYSLTRNLIYSSLFFMILSFISFTLDVLLFTIWEASAIGIIGAADGPSTIFVGNKFSSNMLSTMTLLLILPATLYSAIFFAFNKYSNFSFPKSIIYSLFATIISGVLLFLFFISCISYFLFRETTALGIIGEIDATTIFLLILHFLTPLPLPLIIALLFSIIFFRDNRKINTLPRNIRHTFFVFVLTLLFSLLILFLGEIGFSIIESSAIGIIATGDGPSTIYVGNKFFSSFWKPIVIALPNILALFLFWRNRFKYSTRKNLSYSFSFALFSLFIILIFLFFYEQHSLSMMFSN